MNIQEKKDRIHWLELEIRDFEAMIREYEWERDDLENEIKEFESKQTKLGGKDEK